MPALAGEFLGEPCAPILITILWRRRHWSACSQDPQAPRTPVRRLRFESCAARPHPTEQDFDHAKASPGQQGSTSETQYSRAPHTARGLLRGRDHLFLRHHSRALYNPFCNANGEPRRLPPVLLFSLGRRQTRRVLVIRWQSFASRARPMRGVVSSLCFALSPVEAYRLFSVAK